MKKKLLFGLLLLVILSVGAFFLIKGGQFEVTITQDDIDSTLVKTFPLSKTYLYVVTITYSDPDVTLLEGQNRIQVGLDATLNVRIKGEKKELGGGATVTTGVRYNSETHEFFLDDIQLEELKIQGVPEEMAAQVTNIALKAAQEFFEAPAIYKLEGEDVKRKTARMLLKGVEVRDQKLIVTLGI